MAVPRFHVPFRLSPGSPYALPAEAARHAVQVLRLRAGDALILFDGEGGEYGACIEHIRRAEVVVRVQDHRAVERESALKVHLAQGISSGERMDYALQKAVELGVASIQPLTMLRSVVKLDAERARRRTQHWQQVVSAACEQCGRNRVPEVRAPLSLEHWLATQPSGDKLFLSPEGEAGLDDLAPPTGPLWLLAGPEGGFDARESALAHAAGFRALRLGPRILRTETAALAAIAALQALWGDFRR